MLEVIEWSDSGLRYGFSCSHRDCSTALALTGRADRWTIKKPAEAGWRSVIEIAFQIHAFADEGVDQLVFTELFPLIFSGAVTQRLQGSHN